MKKRLLWLAGGMLFLIVCVVILSFTATNVPSNLHSITLQSPTGQTIPLQVEMATTIEQQKIGLMYRPQVERGMLFVFDEEHPQTFWMKNTLVPLDILFFDANKLYVSATTMQPCTADPCILYPSDAPAQYALEMPAGFLQKNPVGKDWKIEP